MYKSRGTYSYSKKKRLKWSRVILVLSAIAILFFGGKYAFNSSKQLFKNEMKNITEMTEQEAKDYANKNGLEIDFKYEYTTEDEKGLVLEQSIKPGTEIKKNDKITVTISKGDLDLAALEQMGANELGKVPVVMYHGIENITNAETPNKNGNVSKDGYSRTAESFRKDLEMYYQLGYRPVRLTDYVQGIINIPAGTSPMVITFDDGNQNNFNVLKKDASGKIQIDPNSAVGIMEEFNKKYPDFNITATFFLNSSFFGQSEYEKDKLEWLIENGYDVGNHTWGHENLREITAEGLQTTIGKINEKINKYLPDYEVKAFALPFGSHPDIKGDVYNKIFSGEYNGKTYNFDAVMAVGWEPERSPYASKFKASLPNSPGLVMRVRGSDRVGNDNYTDLHWIFNELLPAKRFVSDGDSDIVVIPEVLKDSFNAVKYPNKELLTY